MLTQEFSLPNALFTGRTLDCIRKRTFTFLKKGKTKKLLGMHKPRDKD